MSLLTDRAIRGALGKDIVIDPFDGKKLLTAVGYDFTVGEFVYSLENGLLEPSDGKYEIPAKNTIQVLTHESLWVSGRIAGTFHSKVSLVSMGFSHISTTLDPNWYGPLLITLRNNRNKPLQLEALGAFVTLIFFRVSKPTKTESAKPAYRRDILNIDLEKKTRAYIKKVSQILENETALKIFQEQVNAANKPMIEKIGKSIQLGGVRSIAKSFLTVGLLFVPAVFVFLVLTYWSEIKAFFPNASDEAVIAGFTAVATGIGVALAYLRNKLK